MNPDPGEGASGRRRGRPEPGAAVEATVDVQVRALRSALRRSPVMAAIIDRAADLALPSWYLGAGAVAQTVWNQLHGFETGHGIRDYDLAYFDPDLSADSERAAGARAARLCADLGIKLDVKNQARVHLWYAERFGRPIPPYRSAEHAIATWPSTASSVGVTRRQGNFLVCAPFGLSDLFAMVVRPNKAQVDQAIYEAKATRWKQRWPHLVVIPW
jgi:uncharacterized protein